MRKVIYIAHPFQGKPENVKKAEKIILKLIERYPDYTFYSPLHATGFFYFKKTYEEGMKDCIEMLSRCDEAWFCKGWQNSKGCNIEMNWCKEHEKPYKELQVEDDYVQELLYWDFNDNCPYCNCPNDELDYDLVVEDDDSHHDVVDCPKCGKRLYYETDV